MDYYASNEFLCIFPHALSYLYILYALSFALSSRMDTNKILKKKYNQFKSFFFLFCVIIKSYNDGTLHLQSHHSCSRVQNIA